MEVRCSNRVRWLEQLSSQETGLLMSPVAKTLKRWPSLDWTYLDTTHSILMTRWGFLYIVVGLLNCVLKVLSLVSCPKWLPRVTIQ